MFGRWGLLSIASCQSFWIDLDDEFAGWYHNMMEKYEAAGGERALPGSLTWWALCRKKIRAPFTVLIQKNDRDYLNTTALKSQWYHNRIIFEIWAEPIRRRLSLISEQHPIDPTPNHGGRLLTLLCIMYHSPLVVVGSPPPRWAVPTINCKRTLSKPTNKHTSAHEGGTNIGST